MKLKDTVALMTSSDYKERFKAEYYQTKERYEKLKRFNAKIEAYEAVHYGIGPCGGAKVEEPKHDCPRDLLKNQQAVMREYLHILEVRAVIEGIDLDEPTEVEATSAIQQGLCTHVSKLSDSASYISATNDGGRLI